MADTYGIDGKGDWEKYILRGEKIHLDHTGWLGEEFEIVSREKEEEGKIIEYQQIIQ